MTKAEFERRLEEVSNRACWLDGEECPYGQPGGKFAQRPLVFCQVGVCEKLDGNIVGELNQVFKCSLEEAIESGVEEKLEELTVSSLADEIRKVLESTDHSMESTDYPVDGRKRRILLLAADIIKELDEEVGNGRENKIIPISTFL